MKPHKPVPAHNAAFLGTCLILSDFLRPRGSNKIFCRGSPSLLNSPGLILSGVAAGTLGCCSAPSPEPPSSAPGASYRISAWISVLGRGFAKIPNSLGIIVCGPGSVTAKIKSPLQEPGPSSHGTQRAAALIFAV